MAGESRYYVRRTASAVFTSLVIHGGGTADRAWAAFGRAWRFVAGLRDPPILPSALTGLSVLDTCLLISRGNWRSSGLAEIPALTCAGDRC